VYESTVYPGVTEDVCGPILDEKSGLKNGTDYFLGYSPERINPGDKEHTFERIVKVVSGQTPAALERVAAVYGSVVTAGVHRAPSIKVAEAAKVIENTQRDLNIALMNELALIFDRMGIRTMDVLEAAGTKWNFLKFTPGLVGGHCIGVDPYYLTMKAEELGYLPEVILAGRRVNNGIAAFLAQKTVKYLTSMDVPLKKAKVGILGLTFKENVPDLRNSKIPDIIKELAEYGIDAMVHDPLGDPKEAHEEYKVHITPLEKFTGLDALILAVSHKEYLTDIPGLYARVRDGGAVIDVKSVMPLATPPRGIRQWSL
jgi:UDP-N-acetyl-D-galactosamine dehydrogenase